MNDKRRKQLRELIQKVELIKDMLETIESDEQEYFDTIPENLQGGTNGINSEMAIDKMQESMMCIEDAIAAIEEII